MIDLLLATVDEVLHAGDRVGGAAHGEGARQLAALHDRDAADARLHAVDQRRTLAGRVALRLLASARLERDLRESVTLDVDRTCDRCGKPHGQPRIDGLSASTSTSDGFVLVAVGDADARVGVDVECVPESLWTGFDEYVLHPDERHGMPDGEAGVSERVRVWAEKEAVLKAVGLGLRAAPARLRISAVEMPGGWPTGAGLVDPGAWRPVAATDVRGAGGSWVTTIEGARGAWSVLAAASPQPIRRWTADDLVHAGPS